MRTLIALFLVFVATQAAAQRVALVIGNADYGSVAPLENPGNDSNAIARMLTRQGFDVTQADNLDRATFYDTLRVFRSKADAAEYAVFYYAGHGIEIGGQNYLVPTDAVLEDERDASVEMISMDVVLRQISGASRLKMVVLDACRNNPFLARMKREGAARNVGQGLANVSNAGADTLIAFAAAAGEVTPDGNPGSNSPFTHAFLSAMDGPPADIRRVLVNVRDKMRQSVPGAAPFVYSSLGGAEYVLNPRSDDPARLQVAAPADAALTQIVSDFARADRENTATGWDTFLAQYARLNYHVLYALALEKRSALTADDAIGSRTIPQQNDTQIAAIRPSRPSSLQIIAPPPVDRETALKQLQQALKDRRCYRGAIDGIFGRGSRGALARLSSEIGEDMRVTADTTVAELLDVTKKIDTKKDVLCPIVKPKPVVKKKKTTVTKRVTKAAPASKPAAAAPAPAANTRVQRIEGSNAVSKPVGRRKKLPRCVDTEYLSPPFCTE